MFVDVTVPFEQGKRVKGTLQFEKAGTVEIEYAVEAAGSSPGHHHH
jgi:copper(I)-binding protein